MYARGLVKGLFGMGFVYGGGVGNAILLQTVDEWFYPLAGVTVW